MAISSYKTFLMTNEAGLSGGEWTKLIDIKSFPDLGGAPEKLPTTTLSDAVETSINGIQSMDSMEFLCNYDKSEYETLKALEGQQKAYAVWMGASGSAGALTPTGDNGKYKFMGELSVYINGKGVNEVDEMTITIAPSTVIQSDVA